MFQVEYAEQTWFVQAGHPHRHGQRYYLPSSVTKLNSCGQDPECLKYTSHEAKNQTFTYHSPICCCCPGLSHFMDISSSFEVRQMEVCSKELE